MKFTIAVVVLALAAVSQASVVPLAYAASPYYHGYAASPLSYTAQSPAFAYAYAAPAAIAHHPAAHIHYAAAPAYIAAPAAVIPVQAEGTYTAATRGSVHTAPLPGHAQSAASINLEPAPGTY